MQANLILFLHHHSIFLRAKGKGVGPHCLATNKALNVYVFCSYFVINPFYMHLSIIVLILPPSLFT